jgi:uncharacterized protein YhaN
VKSSTVKLSPYERAVNRLNDLPLALDKVFSAALEDLRRQRDEARKERDESRSQVERLTQELAMARQVSGELCDKCGWAMKFPGEPCRCELEKMVGANCE